MIRTLFDIPLDQTALSLRSLFHHCPASVVHQERKDDACKYVGPLKRRLHLAQQVVGTYVDVIKKANDQCCCSNAQAEWWWWWSAQIG